MIDPLSKREMTVLRMLAQGKSYETIRIMLATARKQEITIENIHSTANIIRRKTGIKNTLDANECRACLRQRHSSYLPDRHTVPTRKQMAVLRLLVAGMPYQEIAKTLGMTRSGLFSGTQSVQNYASQACKRLGIKVAPWQRTHVIREWLAEHDAKTAQGKDPMADPMF